MTTPALKIVVGKTEFQNAYADSMPTYRVVKARGGSTYDCVIVSEDYAGGKKVFSAAEIRQALKWQHVLNTMSSGIDAWYDKTPIGAIVHYDNGFKQYVRCKVVLGTTKNEPGKPQKCLLPLALVGDWRPYDLPHRRASGELVKGYHAECIEKGEMFRPSMVYEQNPRDPNNPANMPAHNLTVPEATPEEAERIRLNKAIEEIREAAMTSVDPQKTLKKLFGMVTKAINS